LKIKKNCWYNDQEIIMKTKRTKINNTRSNRIRAKKIKQKANVGIDRLAIAKANKRTKAKKASKKSFRKKLKKVALILAGVFFIFSSIVLIWFFSYMQTLEDTLPTVDEVFPKDLRFASEIYDRYAVDGNGELLARIINEDINSDPVNIDEIPYHVRFAFVAAEDEAFYEHNGFDPAAILRCAIGYIRRPSNICGGSTITQQLVKITSLGPERKLERKIKELLLATKVEQANTKDEILQMYLQVTNFGSNVYGINTASEFYFRKEPKDLTLAEAAILASIIQNPAYYSPTKGLPDPETAQQRVKDRQLYVLDQLEQNIERFNNIARKLANDPEMDDVLTQEMIDEAREQELVYAEPIANNIKAGHFVDYVINELTSKNYKNGEEPFTREELGSGGYKIITTLDYRIQKIAEDYVKRYGDEYYYWNVNNAALVLTKPATGEVIAMAGSKNYYGESQGCDEFGANCLFNPQVNIITARHSPGSTNKPIGYYLAYEQGKLFPGDFLPDIPIQVPGYGARGPSNFDYRYFGVNYTAEDALRASRNLPALQVIQLVGYKTYLETVRNWGYTTYDQPDESYGASIILGGADVTPIEHAQGYGVFANGGELVHIDPILRVEDKNGKVIYEASPQKVKVADEKAVWLLNQTIKNNGGFSWDGRDVAGKSGTSEENKDAWFVGYSPDFVAMGWAGNNNNAPMDRNNVFGVTVVLPWLKNFMRDVGESPLFASKTPFKQPGFVYEGGGECNEDGECLGLRRSWLIVDKEYERRIKKINVQVCTDQPDRLARPVDIALGFAEEKTFTYYISPVPEWQNYVDAYLANKHSENPVENPLNGGPNEYCNVDRTDGNDDPILNITNPSVGEIISNEINVVGSVYSDNAEITTVSIYFANQLIGTIASGFENINQTYDISTLGLENGVYTFLFDAVDSNGNSSQYVTDITVGSEVNSNLTFVTEPPASLVYGVSVNPTTHTITVNYAGIETINTVELYQVKNNSEVALLGTMTDVGGGNYTYEWGDSVPNESASYHFFAIANINGGHFRSSNSNSVSVN
jgi:penicillin-binding protein 1A